jgi:peptidoglycan/xylan/chitin deacetylase (PgdA/CDA1 family)
MYAEGHEIGNHTFTHPDISLISPQLMRLELNLTERLFASRIGIKTVLFRPPYSIDQEPDTADQVRPLEVTQGLGYITVGNRIDPNDWRTNPSRSAQEIADEVCRRVRLRISGVAVFCSCMTAAATGGPRWKRLRSSSMVSGRVALSLCQ